MKHEIIGEISWADNHRSFNIFQLQLDGGGEEGMCESETNCVLYVVGRWKVTSRDSHGGKK